MGRNSSGDDVEYGIMLILARDNGIQTTGLSKQNLRTLLIEEGVMFDEAIDYTDEDFEFEDEDPDDGFFD